MRRRPLRGERGEVGPTTIRVSSLRSRYPAPSDSKQRAPRRRRADDEPKKLTEMVCNGRPNYNEIHGRTDRSTMRKRRRQPHGPTRRAAFPRGGGKRGMGLTPKKVAPCPTTRKRTVSRVMINHNMPHPHKWAGTSERAARPMRGAAADDAETTGWSGDDQPYRAPPTPHGWAPAG